MQEENILGRKEKGCSKNKNKRKRSKEKEKRKSNQ
jgi:hypothetical protein